MSSPLSLSGWPQNPSFDLLLGSLTGDLEVEPHSGLPFFLVCPGMVDSAASIGRLPSGLPLEPDPLCFLLNCVCHGWYQLAAG